MRVTRSSTCWPASAERPSASKGTHLAQRGVGVAGLQHQGFAEPLQRLAVQPAPREDVPHEGGGAAPRCSLLKRAIDVGRRQLEQTLRHEIGGQREGIVHGRGRRGLRGRLQLVEDPVQQPGIEGEIGAGQLRRHVGRDLRNDGDLRVLVLEIDGQDVLLRDVERIQLERALGGTEGAVEVAQVAEREAQVVVGRSILGVGVHRAAERVAGIFEALELDQDEADSIPGDGIGRSGVQHLAIGFQRQLEPAAMKERQREVEPRHDEVRRGP